MTCYELLGGGLKLIAIAIIVLSILYTYRFCKKQYHIKKMKIICFMPGTMKERFFCSGG